MRTIYYVTLIVVTAIAMNVHATCPQSTAQMELLQGELAVRNRVIVRPRIPAVFRSNATFIVKQVLNIDDPIPPIREIGGIEAFVLDIPQLTTQKMVTLFRASPMFEWAEPDFVVREMKDPNDDLYSELWALRKIKAPSAWDTTTGSHTIVVAVIDSGIYLAHTDLVGNLWSSPKDFNVSIGTTKVSCMTGEHGYDALTKTCVPDAATGHGTHVGGIIGAKGDNDDLVTGVNWTVHLMPLRFIGSNGTGCVSDAVDTLEFARLTVTEVNVANVRVVNMSWGLYAEPTALREQIALVHAENILLIGAAGNKTNNNDTVPFYPASFIDDVLSVASTDENDALSGTSNYGKHSVHLGSPGVDILSTWSKSPYIEIASGTSMAAPYIAGAAALLLSACKPTADQLKEVLLATVDEVASLRTTTIAQGRLNVMRALEVCRTKYP